MTLKPVHFLWKQLNGPQITAIVDALYELLRDMFNPIINYLTTFSINTANDIHLTFIGICSGIKIIIELTKTNVEKTNLLHIVFFKL